MSHEQSCPLCNHGPCKVPVRWGAEFQREADNRCALEAELGQVSGAPVRLFIHTDAQGLGANLVVATSANPLVATRVDDLGELAEVLLSLGQLLHQEASNRAAAAERAAKAARVHPIFEAVLMSVTPAAVASAAVAYNIDQWTGETLTDAEVIDRAELEEMAAEALQ